MKKKCVVCGGGFSNKHPQAKTCGRKKCRAVNKIATTKLWRHSNPESVRLHHVTFWERKKDAINRARRLRRMTDLDWAEKDRSSAKRHYWKNRSLIRSRQARNYAEQRAALRLVRELQTKGIGALL
jgi:hypothetical protein